MDAWDCKRARGIQDESPEAAVERNMFARVKEVAKEHAQWWNPILNAGRFGMLVS